MAQYVKKQKNYLNNKDMLEQFRLSKAQGRMTEEFGKMMMLLVHKYLKHPKFYRYSNNYKMELESNALVTLCKVWEGFDDTRSENPFAYYTQVCTNAFIQILNQEKKQRDIRDELKLDAGLNASYSYQERHADSMEDGDYSEQYDSQHEFDTLDKDWADDTVYDVTEEYTSVLEEAFSVEPIEPTATPVQYDDEDFSDIDAAVTTTPIPTPHPTATPEPTQKVIKAVPLRTTKPTAKFGRKVSANSSSVVYVKASNCWQARLMIEGQSVHSRSYQTQEGANKFKDDAHRLYNEGTPANQIQTILRSWPEHTPPRRNARTGPDRLPKSISLRASKNNTNGHKFIAEKNGYYYVRIGVLNYHGSGFTTIEEAVEHRNKVLRESPLAGRVKGL